MDVAVTDSGGLVTTVSAEHAAASAGPTGRTILARRSVLIAAAIAAVLVAIAAGLLLATSDHLVDPIPTASSGP